MSIVNSVTQVQPAGVSDADWQSYLNYCLAGNVGSYYDYADIVVQSATLSVNASAYPTGVTTITGQGTRSVSPDGATTFANPDGSSTVIDPSGNVYQISPAGAQVTVTNAGNKGSTNVPTALSGDWHKFATLVATANIKGNQDLQTQLEAIPLDYAEGEKTIVTLTGVASAQYQKDTGQTGVQGWLAGVIFDLGKSNDPNSAFNQKCIAAVNSALAQNNIVTWRPTEYDPSTGDIVIFPVSGFPVIVVVVLVVGGLVLAYFILNKVSFYKIQQDVVNANAAQEAAITAALTKGGLTQTQIDALNKEYGDLTGSTTGVATANQKIAATPTLPTNWNNPLMIIAGGAVAVGLLFVFLKARK